MCSLRTRREFPVGRGGGWPPFCLCGASPGCFSSRTGPFSAAGSWVNRNAFLSVFSAGHCGPRAMREQHGEVQSAPPTGVLGGPCHLGGSGFLSQEPPGTCVFRHGRLCEWSHRQESFSRGATLRRRPEGGISRSSFQSSWLWMRPAQVTCGFWGCLPQWQRSWGELTLNRW